MALRAVYNFPFIKNNPVPADGKHRETPVFEFKMFSASSLELVNLTTEASAF